MNDIKKYLKGGHLLAVIVILILLLIAVTGTTWEAIEYRNNEGRIDHTIEYGLWDVCNVTRYEKPCHKIKTVSDELIATRAFICASIFSVLLHALYTSVMYIRVCYFKQDYQHTFLSLILMWFAGLACVMTLAMKSSDKVDEVKFDGKTNTFGFSFKLTISACVLSFFNGIVGFIITRYDAKDAEDAEI